MTNKIVAVLVVALSSVACDQMYPSRPSPIEPQASSASIVPGRTASAGVEAPQAQKPNRVGFGFNGIVSGFATGQVFLTGGGAFDRLSGFVNSAGGFRCIKDVLQGPLSTSINPENPGPCLAGEGVRWDTAALLGSTTFKCTGAATEPLKTAVTSDNTVVLQADFYRTGDGNEESFTAKIIVSDRDIASDFPGARLWVERVGCGAGQAVNFGK